MMSSVVYDVKRSLTAKGDGKDSLLRSNSLGDSLIPHEDNSIVGLKHFGSRPSYKTITTQKSKKTVKSIRLSDLMAAMYPGIKIGHKFCVQRSMLVPKTMGWLWNTEDTAAGVPFPRGWRPGAIAMGVKKKFLRPRSITEPLSTPIGSKGKKIKRKVKTTGSHFMKSVTASSQSCTEVQIPSTLFVKKEGGVYQVQMRPINPLAATEDDKEEQPVTFKIAESSASSHSANTKSSSPSVKVEYMCTGALRKQVIKPKLLEIGTQWDTSDFLKKEPQRDPEVKKGTDKDTKGKKYKSQTADENREQKKKIMPDTVK